MTNVKIGVQMSTLKTKLKELGPYETLRGVRELGYRYIELSQLSTSRDSLTEIKRACQDFGIEVSAMSASLEPSNVSPDPESLTTHFEKIVDDCKFLNCKFLRIGIIPFNALESKAKVIEFAQKCDAVSARLALHGIDLYYHNHHIEFLKLDGEYILDIIKHHASKMGFELDVHWIQRGGEEPIKFIKQYVGRVKLLHLKDFRITKLDTSPLATGDISGFMTNFLGLIEFAEIGEGTLDFQSIIETGVACGAQYFFVEQDTTYGRDEFESLKISAENLRRLGFMV
ncbi:MAG: sugar phosphate isomerase/epimerase [Eubacteriales bacterium]|nr:sugar phosphate isomerase/epimerase [Eubacteriales bacterium]